MTLLVPMTEKKVESSDRSSLRDFSGDLGSLANLNIVADIFGRTKIHLPSQSIKRILFKDSLHLRSNGKSLATPSDC